MVVFLSSLGGSISSITFFPRIVSLTSISALCRFFFLRDEKKRGFHSQVLIFLKHESSIYSGGLEVALRNYLSQLNAFSQVLGYSRELTRHTFHSH